jgi:peptidoglycan/xylan/chitin deacetylase (PgdA/CDA1 family)
MYVTPSTFKSHIRFYKIHFNIVPLCDAEYLIRNKSSVSSKPNIILTFDDGWYDFYVHAWPILKDESVPGVVFLPTGYIGTDRLFWTDRLALILNDLKYGKILKKATDSREWGSVIRANSFDNRFSRAIKILKRNTHEEIESFLDECELIGGVQNYNNNRAFMNWQEARELFGYGQISFGSHTVNHAILTSLSNTAILEELKLSKEKLIEEKVVGDSIPFCYPNGNYNTWIAQSVKEIGYSCAVTCDSGWNKSESSLFNLRRIGLHQDISSTTSLLTYRLYKH